MLNGYLYFNFITAAFLIFLFFRFCACKQKHFSCASFIHRSLSLVLLFYCDYYYCCYFFVFVCLSSINLFIPLCTLLSFSRFTTLFNFSSTFLVVFLFVSFVSFFFVLHCVLCGCPLLAYADSFNIFYFFLLQLHLLLLFSVSASSVCTFDTQI